MKKEKLFTVGEFAKAAGITIRTLRYYDKIGLLKPCEYNKSGYRLYNKRDFGKLQNILTLKFIGLSLEDIKYIIEKDISDENFKKSLEIQKSIMEQKIHHLNHVIRSIDETIQMVNKNEGLDWDKFIDIISIINIDNKWMEQYYNASNLRERIKIHELYSTNKEGWMEWYFKFLNFNNKKKVLELGCGDATFWTKNLDKIPEGLEITLTDFSEGMLMDAMKNLEKAKMKFSFRVVNIEEIPFDDNSFDIIIANHMLYHAEELDKALSEIKRVLKPDGLFYASTVGKGHMKEMRELVGNIDEELLNIESFNLTKKFQLENAEDILKDYFNHITLKRYEDSLKLTDIEALINYILSMPGTIEESFDYKKINDLKVLLKDKITDKGYIYITKDTGFFMCEK
ncbi:methyltransferase domain-containing protein [Clostridium sp. BSD9I1]|uniref:MerR family transcriptional regulator n=1 Tax=Clostridium sp. BSD9I1 TaxID=2003589 RepID=UPI0016442F00|nr:methyltransferase domain-containing protein [Clostridium sp. BSD9I1]